MLPRTILTLMLFMTDGGDNVCDVNVADGAVADGARDYDCDED